MSKTYRIIAALLVIAVAAGGAYYFLQQRRAAKAGLLTEDIRHEGDTWKADFTARIPAPEPQVFDTIKNVENAHSDEIKRVDVLSQTANEKTVQMQVAGPGGQTITTRLAFQYFPEQHKITYHTVDSGDLMTNAEYDLDSEGQGTVMNFHETAKVSQQIPVPDGVVKQVIRGIFIAQLEGLKKALHVETAEEDDAADEPE